MNELFVNHELGPSDVGRDEVRKKLVVIEWWILVGGRLRLRLFRRFISILLIGEIIII